MFPTAIMGWSPPLGSPSDEGLASRPSLPPRPRFWPDSPPLLLVRAGGRRCSSTTWATLSFRPSWLNRMRSALTAGVCGVGCVWV